MSEEKNKLGERIASYRNRLEMSVETFAEKSGVSPSVIRAIESGEVYPALGILVRLSRALGQRLGTFMDDQYSPDPIVVRAESRKEDKTSHIDSNAAGFHYFPLGQGKVDRHIDPFYVEIAGDSQANISSHEGEEFIVVIDGEVELSYGEEKTILKAGDSAYYNSVVKHRVAAAGGKPAKIYAAIFMPYN
jgi:transcriptional regulator with XRE-family HTH domain